MVDVFDVWRARPSVYDPYLGKHLAYACRRVGGCGGDDGGCGGDGIGREDSYSKKFE